MNKRKKSSRFLASLVAGIMVFTMIPQGAFAAESILKGTSDVSFGNTKAYDVNAEVKLKDGVIENVTLNHNAAEKNHENSVSFAEAAKKIAEGFIGKKADDKVAIENVAAISGATVTSVAYKNAVLDALGHNKVAGDFTFGSSKTKLAEGEYTVPVSLQNAMRHEKPSNAAEAFPEMAKLVVSKDGKATLTTDVKSVTFGPITDMAYDIKYYLEDGFEGTAKDVTVIEKIKKPAGMPGAGKDVPTKISFEIPNNDFDGIYLNFAVDAMGPAYPDAWLKVDYVNAKEPGDIVHYKGSAKVNQFGKYTIYTDISVRDGVITNVDVTADNFISETHRPTNEMKIAQVAEALKSAWNGIAPTKENAEKIFKTIMKKEDPSQVVAAISGATYSGKAVRDSVMNAFDLEYQDEVINVPKSIEPGQYQVDVEYASDVVWHSLVENQRTEALLTVNEDKTMYLDMDLKSGTDKEPLYILGFNGTYPNNDRAQKLTKDGCEMQMGLSTNDYEDENFAKGTQVVNHVRFPLNGGLNKVYNTNAYLYVPAMKRLNGELSGVYFENGKFNVDIFAKIYWDGMKKIGEEKIPLVKNVKVKTDNGLFKVYFDKVKGAEYHKVAIKESGKSWKYFNVKGNSLLVKKMAEKNRKYYIKVAPVVDGKRGEYTPSKVIYANRVGNRSAVMYSPKFLSIKRYNSGKTKVAVKNVSYKGETYKVAYRLKGTKTWKNTNYSSSTVRYIKGLKKGRTYTFATQYRYRSLVDRNTYVYSKTVYKTVKLK